MTRARNLQPRLWIAAGDRVGILRCSLRMQCAASGSARVSSLAISTIPIGKASGRVIRDQPTHGQKFLSRAQAGSLSIPTHRSVGGFNLIPVAVVRDIQQAVPVSGNFVGMTDAFAGMSVEVVVTS